MVLLKLGKEDINGSTGGGAGVWREGDDQEGSKENIY